MLGTNGSCTRYSWVLLNIGGRKCDARTNFCTVTVARVEVRKDLRHLLASVQLLAQLA